MHAQSVGVHGEDLVADWLLARGCRILDRNIWFSFGEIDILAKSSKNELLLVEVKSRTSETHGTPADAVTTQKRQRLLQCARAIERQYPDHPLRFLIAEVVGGRVKKVYQDTLDS